MVELTKKQRKAFVLIADMLAKISMVDRSPAETEELNLFMKQGKVLFDLQTKTDQFLLERERLLRAIEIWMVEIQMLYSFLLMI
jgi:hypothetical protein